jgi:PAS domain S-box-containing protein
MPDDASQRIVHRALLGEAIEGLKGVAVFVWDEHRHYVAVNDGACELTGLTRSELIGMPVGDRTSTAERTMEEASHTPVLNGTMSFLRRDGEIIEIEYVTVHTHIANLPFMVSICWPTDR